MAPNAYTLPIIVIGILVIIVALSLRTHDHHEGNKINESIGQAKVSDASHVGEAVFAFLLVGAALAFVLLH